MKRLSFNSSNSSELSTERTLLLIGLAGLVTILMTTMPILNLLNYPFRLLLTLVHELAHGLAALLTGGDFIRFMIFTDGSGRAYTAGGWRLLVIPAGYLGTALFGAVLIILGRSHRWSRLAMAFVGATMMFLTLRYGIPNLFSGRYFLGGILTVVSGVAFGSIFLSLALRSKPGEVIFLIHLVAIQAGTTAFSDIMTLVGLSVRNAPFNDAQSMAELTFIPAIVWAVLWIIGAMLLIGGAIWFTWLMPIALKQR